MKNSTSNRQIQGLAHGVLFAVFFIGAHWILVGHRAPITLGIGCLFSLGLMAAFTDGLLSVRLDGRSSWLVRLCSWGIAAIGGLYFARGWVSPDAWLFVLGASAVGGLVFQYLRLSDLIRGSSGDWCENIRLVLLPVIVVWLFRPFFDSKFFGGVDARSYGYTMVDVLRQVRAGVFPVFVGQSEFMFNGAIHPIRTAPYHHYLGIALDQITFRSLTPLAVQHLTVVVTALQAGVMCYLSLLWVAPRRRWLAWVMAALYVSSPATCGYIYGQEMYMTFMTFGWLPLVMVGNVRLIRNDDFLGWVWLTSGLALVWISHAPVALWLSICSISIQFIRLFLRDFNRGAWKRAVCGLLFFCGLTVYYFWSMAEISQAGRTSSSWVAAVVLFTVGVAATTRFIATTRWTWFIAAVFFAICLRFGGQLYAGWLGFYIFFSLSWVVLSRSGFLVSIRQRLPELMVLSLLIAGLLSALWRPRVPASPSLAWVERTFPHNFFPVSAYAQQLTDLQLGYALWIFLLVGFVFALWSSSLERRLIALAGMLGVSLLLPIPGLTKLLLTAIPEQLYAISSDITWLRYLPTMVILAVFGGFMGLSAAFERFNISRGLILMVAVVALSWSFWEAEKFVRCGFRNTNTAESINAFYRPELVRQFSYVFHGLPVSPYLTNGVIDYQLESRLLRLEDPQREAIEAVDFKGAREVVLTTTADSTSPNWLYMEPKLNLASGEHLLLRFEFFSRNYTGTLILRGSEGFYRDYPMPAAGFYAKSFGVDPNRPKTIAVWNTSAKRQPVELVFLRTELPADGREFGEFARVLVQPYVPDRLPIYTESLIPYRARVRSSEPAWLETPRAFIPGYKASVNGREVEVVTSPNSMVMLKVPAGSSVVQLDYAGTRYLWLAMAVSLASWLGLCIIWLGLTRKVSSEVTK